MSQNITIILIRTFDNTKIETKSKIETKPGTISSKLMTKQWGVTLYVVTPGGQIPNFDQK
jgi:hypothetical protein